VLNGGSISAVNTTENDMEDPDRKLVAQAKQGDRQAFEKLVKRYQNKVLYLAFDLIGNYTDAQDVAQNVFLQAFRNIAYFRAEATFSTWIYKITTNAAIDFQRSQKRRRAIFMDQTARDNEENSIWEQVADPEATIVQKVEQADLKELIEQTVGQLSPQQRAAFVLKYFHDQSTDAIAKILGCDPVTVRGHLMRATLKLRKKLKDER
jgi:RNA polymerase sigma-70 factor (ECF subfamily)